MDMICNTCKIEISSKSQYLLCSNCNKYYDLDCLNISGTNFTNFSLEYKDNWNCPSCVCVQPKSVNLRSLATSSLVSKNMHPSNSDNVKITTRGSRAKMQQQESTQTDSNLLLSEIRLLRQEVSDLKQQNTDIGLKLSNFSEALNQKVEDFEKKLSAKDNEIILLKSSIMQLEQKLNLSEQDNMKSELEIIGIPEENNENLVHITLLTATKIGLQLSEADIDEVYRIGSRRTNPADKPRPIVLRLTRRAKRIDVLKAAKERRPLTSDDIITGTSSNIYINERLTKTNRILFREARKRTEFHNFRFCWLRNGTIYVRKAEKQASIPIRTPSDLDEKVGPPQAAVDIMV